MAPPRFDLNFSLAVLCIDVAVESVASDCGVPTGEFGSLISARGLETFLESEVESVGFPEEESKKLVGLEGTRSRTYLLSDTGLIDPRNF